MQLVILLAILAYFLYAVGSIMDKHIVSNTSLSPIPYAFYSGFFQVLYVIAFPLAAMAAPNLLSFNMPSPALFLLAVFDGIVFIIALVAMYEADEEGEISRISPIIGVLVPVFSFILSYLFLKETLSGKEFAAFVFFILGGFLMSAKIGRKKFSCIRGTSFAVLAGFLFGLYYVIMKHLFGAAGFVETFILIQLGGFLGSLLLLIRPKDRKDIFAVSKHKKKDKKNAYGTTVFVTDKLLAAAGSLILYYAISLGNVTLINALQAIQYVFILIFSIILTKEMPRFFKEDTREKVITQKGMALVLTAIGIILIA